MKRVIAVLVASFAAFLGLLQPAEATMESTAVVAQTYTYNSQHDAAAFAYAATERGPPSRYDRRTSHSVTDPWSVGASTRSQAVASCAITTNDADRTLVQVAQATSTTWEQAQTADGSPAVLNRAGVAANAANGARLAEDLSAAQAANPLIHSLRASGGLPTNYVTKSQAAAAGWSPGKALDDYVPGGQLGGDVFKNPAGIGLPTAPRRTWYEADIGLSGSISRAKQPGTRLLYSNDGMAYVTPDHYGRLYQLPGW